MTFWPHKIHPSTLQSTVNFYFVARGCKKAVFTMYLRSRGCRIFHFSLKLHSTLILLAMGGISPYKSVTWQQPVGIGLRVSSCLHKVKTAEPSRHSGVFVLSLHFLHFGFPCLVVCKLRNKSPNAYLVFSYLISTVKMIGSKDVPQLVKEKEWCLQQIEQSFDRNCIKDQVNPSFTATAHRCC